jgi:hypothetical protein
MTETLDTNAAVIEAIAVIDASLARFATRELLSGNEMADLLLDLRSVLTAAHDDRAETSIAAPVGA